MLLKSFFTKLRKDNRGGTAVEFALIMPTVLLFTFGFFEFCRAVYAQNILSYSAAEASRFAMVNFDRTNEEEVYLNAQKASIEAFANNSLGLTK